MASLTRGWLMGGVAAAIALSCGTASASTLTLNFAAISTNSGAANAAAAAANLRVDVDPAGTNQVKFTTYWTTEARGVITGIYFDDGTLLGISSVFNNGPNFVQGGSPGDLPGGNNINPAFQTTAGFYATASGVKNGIEELGDYVAITFNLIQGQTFNDVVNALNQATGVGGLRVGLRVQSIIPGGQGDGFVNLNPIPLPVASVMGLAGLGLVGGIRRRR
jgi:hypothetical protein